MDKQNEYDLKKQIALSQVSFVYEAKYRPKDSYSNQFLKRVLCSERDLSERILSGCCIFRELEDKLKELGIYRSFRFLLNANRNIFLNNDLQEDLPYCLQGILLLENAILLHLR